MDRFFLRVFIDGYLWRDGNSLEFHNYEAFLRVWAAETLYHMLDRDKSVSATFKKVNRDCFYNLYVVTKKI
jgi:hypothetical protein